MSLIILVIFAAIAFALAINAVGVILAYLWDSVIGRIFLLGFASWLLLISGKMPGISWH